MITAVDSSVLLDVLVAGAPNADRSYRDLEAAREAGRVVACPIVWAEVGAVFEHEGEMEALVEAGVEFDPFDRDVAETAVALWRAYRRQGGPRARSIADFLVAAHGQVRADAFLTRERAGFLPPLPSQPVVGRPGPSA